MIDRDDQSLIRDIQGGDREALATLYDRYADQLMAVGSKYLSNEAVVEELIHDLFLQVWRSAHDYDADRGSVCTWLMVRMRSRALDKLRYEDRRDHDRLEDAACAGLLTADENPAEDFEHDWIRRSVRELPERLQGVLVYTYYHELTGPEVAGRLDIPVGTVRSRLADARRRLRKHVVPDDETVADE
ncbi:MAG: sigma-70 family RNA polymerase sigma factor [Bradymonadaceae bacterium]